MSLKREKDCNHYAKENLYFLLLKTILSKSNTKKSEPYMILREWLSMIVVNIFLKSKLFHQYYMRFCRNFFQTINLIRQEDTSLPVLFNKKETGEYLSFRSVPIPGKNNRKDWCWIIDVSELNRILESLGLPILLKTDQEVILKNDNAELNLELGKKVQIVKARKKVYLETY